jgi:hypothetical protein
LTGIDWLMAREPVFRGKEQSPEGPEEKPTPADLDDPRYDNELRPQRLSDVVGQRKALDRKSVV